MSDRSNSSEGDYYKVEKIIEKRLFGNGWKYLIKWEGYPSTQNSWEPLENMNGCDEILEEFERKLKERKTSDIKSKPKSRTNSNDIVLLSKRDAINKEDKNDVAPKPAFKEDKIKPKEVKIQKHVTIDIIGEKLPEKKFVSKENQFLMC